MPDPSQARQGLQGLFSKTRESDLDVWRIVNMAQALIWRSGKLKAEGDGCTQVLDHFEWNYSTAMAQALATTISPSMPAFLKEENTGMRVVRELLHGPFFTILSMLLWIPAKVVVMIGKLALANVQDSQASMVAALYRFAVNMLFAFFTVPMYILTHLTYYM